MTLIQMFFLHYKTILIELNNNISFVWVDRKIYLKYSLLQCTWAHFNRASEHKICLSWNFCLDKNWIFRISKQQLNTSNKHYATNGNLVGTCNPVFIKEEISCLANFCAKQIYEIGSWCRHVFPNWVNLLPHPDLKIAACFFLWICKINKLKKLFYHM